MAEVTVPVTQDNAVLLLAAAEELGLPADVVRYSEDGFIADEKVVKKAGLHAESEDDDKPAAKKTAAKKTTAASKE